MKAWQLLQEKNWTQGSNARDIYGNPVSICSEKAESFCAVGALMKCCLDYTEYSNNMLKVSNLIKQKTDGKQCCIAFYNDAKGRTRTEMINLLKEADA